MPRSKRAVPLPGGRVTLERSQTGAIAICRPSCTLLARRLKYSDNALMLSGTMASTWGRAGAAQTETPSAETKSNESCMVAIWVIGRCW